MLGDLVSVDGKICKVIELGGMACVTPVDYEDELFCNDVDIEPIPIAPEILEKNGWEKTSAGYCVLKGYTTRLGWRNGEMVVGYSALPEKILNVHELQNLMKAVKIDKGIEV